MNRLAVLLLLVLAGCGGHPATLPAPEPVVVTRDVNVPTPVPCPALARLGPDPTYADTDAAIAAAPDIFEVSRLYALGRLQRIRRLGEYAAARAACTF